MNEIERKARGLFAAELEADHRMFSARMIQSGQVSLGADYRAALRAIRAALTPPEGYVLVPVEPTEAMLRSGGGVEPSEPIGQQCIEAEGARLCWALMLAARPEVSP